MFPWILSSVLCVNIKREELFAVLTLATRGRLKDTTHIVYFCHVSCWFGLECGFWKKKKMTHLPAATRGRRLKRDPCCSGCLDVAFRADQFAAMFLFTPPLIISLFFVCFFRAQYLRDDRRRNPETSPSVLRASGRRLSGARLCCYFRIICFQSAGLETGSPALVCLLRCSMAKM